MIEARFVYHPNGAIHIYLPEYHDAWHPLCNLVFRAEPLTAPYDILNVPPSPCPPCRRCFPHIARVREVEREGERVERGHARILQMYRPLERKGVYDIRDRITESGRPCWHITIREPVSVMAETG